MLLAALKVLFANLTSIKLHPQTCWSVKLLAKNWSSERATGLDHVLPWIRFKATVMTVKVQAISLAKEIALLANVNCQKQTHCSINSASKKLKISYSRARCELTTTSTMESMKMIHRSQQQLRLKNKRKLPRSPIAAPNSHHSNNCSSLSNHIPLKPRCKRATSIERLWSA